MRRPGGVHEHVEAAERPLGRGDHGARAGVVRDVGTVEQRAGAEGLHAAVPARFTYRLSTRSAFAWNTFSLTAGGRPSSSHSRSSRAYGMLG